MLFLFLKKRKVTMKVAFVKSLISSLIVGLCIQFTHSYAQVFTYVDENGITMFTNKKPDTNKFEVTNHGCFGTCIIDVNWASIPLNQNIFADEVNSAASKHNVDHALVRAIIHAESWFKADALSKAGAQGLMQLMPATQARFGVTNAYDPKQNIVAGVKYLAWLFNEFEHDETRVIAAYNAGENAVKRYNGVPPFSETQEYLRRVKILYSRYQKQGVLETSPIKKSSPAIKELAVTAN